MLLTLFSMYGFLGFSIRWFIVESLDIILVPCWTNMYCISTSLPLSFQSVISSLSDPISRQKAATDLIQEKFVQLKRETMERHMRNFSL